MSPSSKLALAIDIGGTKVIVATYRQGGGGLQKLREKRYSSREYAGLEPVLNDYGIETGTLAVVAGVAGPVVDGVANITNLPWHLNEAALTKDFAIPFKLINDLAAHGYGVAKLDFADPTAVVTLQEGANPPLKPGQNAALIAAGTGLGEALLFWDGQRHVPSPSEGGHTDFGPGGLDDLALCHYLFGRYERVSWERVVSGLDGFRNIYLFLRDTGRIPPIEACDSALATDKRADLGEVIIAGAAQGIPGAVMIVEWLVRLYGAEAGNLALKGLALSGVFVGGGLAPRILPWMRSETFLSGFLAKGRFRSMLQKIPVHLILDADLALKGAAHLAFEGSH